MTHPSTQTPGAPNGATLGTGAPLGGQSWIPEVPTDTGRYRLHFARTEGDLEAALRLRFEVFNLELNEGLPESYASGLDRDEFDAQCQHLMVIDTATGEVVGTYRMQVAESARAGNGFYSATEYDLSMLPEGTLDRAVELGRACVAREHRRKSVLFLLWRGMLSYVRANQRPLFFGCSSLTSQDTALGLRAYRDLQRRGWIHPDLHVEPLPAFRCAPDGAPGTDHANSDEPVDFPTLFSLYLRYGARVIGAPAIDRTFGTIDFLTLFDTGTFSARLLASLLR